MNIHQANAAQPVGNSRRTFLSGLAATAVGATASARALAAGSAPAGGAPAAGASNDGRAAKSPVTRLNNGIEMPVFGVGTLAMTTYQTADLVDFALRNGYRLIDTAKNYGVEKQVGEGIARSGIPRSELFVTTKLWIEDFGYDEALRAFDRSLGELGLDYLDLYLLHWPVPSDFDKTIAAYKALEKLYADKRIRAIGVSNFEPEHLQRLMDNTDVVPALNQIELHPYLTQQDSRAANERHGIKTEAWCPIGGGFVNLPKDWTRPVRLLEDATIVGLAQKHRKSAAQIVSRWHVQQGRIVIPKSQHYERLLANIEIFDFELAPEEMAAIDALNRNLRAGPDPRQFDVPAFQAIVQQRQVRVY